MSTKRKSEVRARVVVAFHQPMDSVIPTHVLITTTLILATSTSSTLVVLADAMELDHSVSAISLLARACTRTTEHATTTKRTSGVLAGVLLELNRHRVSVIPLIARSTVI